MNGCFLCRCIGNKKIVITLLTSLTSHSSVKRTNPVKIFTDGFHVCFLERTTIRKPVLAWGRARDINNSNMGNCAPPGQQTSAVWGPCSSCYSSCSKLS